MGIVSFSPKQDGTGDPSPTNVRPIHPGLVLKSKNLLNPDDVHDGYIRTDDSIGSGSQWHYTDYLEVTDERTYTVSGSIVTGTPAAQFVFYNESKSKIGSIHSGPSNFTFIPPTGTKYVRLSLKGDDPFQLELGSIPTEYEPYYDMEIYGGYVDFENGEVVAEWKQVIFDGSQDENWVKSASTPGNFYISISDADVTTYAGSNGSYAVLCNHLKTNGNSPMPDGACFISSAHNFNAKIGTIIEVEDVTGLRTYLGSNNLQVVYLLETPITYSLTASQLTQAYNQLVPVSPVMINKRRRILLNTPHLETASGSIATFDTDMKSKLKECKINFLPVQSGSGDPSPTNVRNISGWNSINGCHTRKNLLNIDALISSPSNTVNNFNFKHYLELKLKPNTYYTVSTSYNDSGLNVLYANGVNGDKNGVKADTPRTILSSSDGIVFLMLYDRNGIEKFENKEVTVQLEEGNIVTSYEPVNNIPVSWESEAGLLYGGYVDLTTGELAKEWESISLDQLNYSLNTVLSGVDRFYTTIANVVPPAGTRDLPNVISDRFKAEAIYDANNNHSIWSVCGNGSTYYFYTPSGEYSSATEFRNAMKDTQFLCKRRTPIATYQLTPQQIKTLIGRNNFRSDAGDVEIKYWTH